MKQILQQGVDEGVFPGCAAAVGTADEVRFEVAGHLMPGGALVDFNTVYDLASLTKVICTATAARVLVSRGLLDLDVFVGEYLPGYAPRITSRNLLLHDSGLPAYPELWRFPASEFWSRVYAVELEAPPGSRTCYSCLGFLVLQRVIESVSGLSFRDFVTSSVLQPFELSSSSFGSASANCAPTNRRGVVHDPLAFMAGGAAGNAGLFSTIGDIARFAQLVLRGDSLFDASWCRRQGLGDRGLGWDIKSREGSCLSSSWSSESFGHLGYTGTSLWIDPEAGRFAVLLSNRVHPTEENRKIVEFRPRFHSVAALPISQRDFGT